MVKLATEMACLLWAMRQDVNPKEVWQETPY